MAADDFRVATKNGIVPVGGHSAAFLLRKQMPES
jgi:hypothetical protein